MTTSAPAAAGTAAAALTSAFGSAENGGASHGSAAKREAAAKRERRSARGRWIVMVEDLWTGDSSSAPTPLTRPPATLSPLRRGEGQHGVEEGGWPPAARRAVGLLPAAAGRRWPKAG